MTFIDDITILDQQIVSLCLELSTVDAGDAFSGNPVFANVVFNDGTRLYEPHNASVGFPPGKGDTHGYHLPVPDGLQRKLSDVAEVYVRKAGSNGWFVGSVLLFANDNPEPLIGCRHVNQFLDNDDDVLHLRDWSTKSLCVAPKTAAEHPLPLIGYRMLGPIIGQLGATTATILYRVDREGSYRFRVEDAATGIAVFDQIALVEPTVRFEVDGLLPNHEYTFSLSFVLGSAIWPVPDGSGSFRTYPPDGTPGRFSMAFGSCANPDKQVSQGAWNGIRSLATMPPPDIEPVRLFVHLGDSFYFYDHMTEEVVKNRESMEAAHVSMRRNLEFLDMAQFVPVCGVWDDHDFAKDNTYSKDLDSALHPEVVDAWLSYWGNTNLLTTVNPGISTLVSHGLVDCYLLDGRIQRDPDAGIHFGQELIGVLQNTIRERGRQGGRVVVLATGSNWSVDHDGDENYGDDDYDAERATLYSALTPLMGNAVNGLILLSGDDHVNEIYHVDLGDGKVAPELVSSPLTRNTGLKSARPNKGERVASFSSDDDKRGFATLEIDTTDPVADGNWTATVRYYREAATIGYHERTYVLSGGQFL